MCLHRAWSFGTALAALLVWACGGRVDPNDGVSSAQSPSCLPGQQIECSCGGSQSSVQVCQRDGTFAPCQCTTASSTTTPSVSTAGSGSVSSGAGGAGGAGGTGVGGGSAVVDGGAVSGTQLSAGSTPLIDVFVASGGVYVIHQDSIVLFDRSGNRLQSIASPRQITSAAFDGKNLVVADRARFTTYNVSLGVVASADLAEECASSVLVSGDRFVCGPKNDWDRVLYTHNARTGELLATSKKYTYKGIPMRRVPGTNDFVTVSGGSPSDFHLYSVVDSGEAVYVNESPYHGDFRVTRIYAFDGSPPVHLITDAALMLRIYGDKCAAGSSFTSQCFVKDGALGTLTGAQVFVAMTSDERGKLYALVSPTSDVYGTQACKAGCLLERVDPSTRTIESKVLVHLDFGASVALRRDDTGRGVVLGYELGTASFRVPSDPYPGYRVVLFPD